ncbi:hypothetical protein SEVIR_9G320600v4 [Setaria viridis]|uniref:Uncharacterized protein n=2 Tax=Setaria TaxID=4554 RepID=K4AHJ0_SETIT|nr:hypothetical protein SETIT_9G315000v2 [Setaria italica]TKV94814.1 hypothetical protein SEVIR_9G320600v2 [Setaria viridis]
MEKRPLGMAVFLMAFLVISGMHTAPAQAAGRIISRGSMNPNIPHDSPLDPNKAGDPYPGRGRACTSIYHCHGAAEP